MNEVSKMDKEAIYMVGDQEVVLTPNIVVNFLASGDNQNLSTQEIVTFINLCKFNGLNPWLKEAYCIKYGNSPATMVVGKDAYLKRAEANAAYDGLDAGIIVQIDGKTVERRTGTLHLPNEKIVGGWAKVWRTDRSRPFSIEISFDEYAGKRKDGSLNAQWNSKPATMIRKVALVQALREAFPGNIEGMCSEDEIQEEHERPSATMQTEVPHDNLPIEPAEPVKEVDPDAEPVEVQVEIVETEELPFA